MCNFNGPINTEYVRDLHRGRFEKYGRFREIDEYAYARWQKAKDMRHAKQWYQVMEAVKRRQPDWLVSKLDPPKYTH